MADDAEFERFFDRCMQAFRRHLRGEPGPFLELWSRGDVAVLGAGGSHAEGFADVSTHLRHASASLDWSDLAVTRLLTAVSGDLAMTVTLERMGRHTGEEPSERILRTTQGYRREDGAWRVILRHANPVTPEDERHEKALLAADAPAGG